MTHEQRRYVTAVAPARRSPVHRADRPVRSQGPVRGHRRPHRRRRADHPRCPAAHLDAELHIDPADIPSPVQAASASALSFTPGALLPLLAILLPPAAARVPVTSVAVLIALGLTGALSGQELNAIAGVCNRENVRLDYLRGAGGPGNHRASILEPRRGDGCQRRPAAAPPDAAHRRRQGVERPVAAEAAARHGRLRVLFMPNEPGFPPGCWLVPALQGREYALQAELAFGRIEVELVLVTRQRLGWEGRGCPARRPAHAGRRRPTAR